MTSWPQQTLLPYVLGHTPAGTSTQTVLHFAQMVNSGRFCKYDYGQEENQRKYGQATPPEYDLRQVKVPVTLIWGQNDWLADPKVSAKAQGGFLKSRNVLLIPIYTPI